MVKILHDGSFDTIEVDFHGYNAEETGSSINGACEHCKLCRCDPVPYGTSVGWDGTQQSQVLFVPWPPD